MGAALNLIGQKFGKLTVLEKTDQRKGNSIVWKCKCDCNGEHSIVYVATNQLTSGKVQSCGCLVHKEKYIDLTGQTFGRWKVLNFVKIDKKTRNAIWHCQCNCENHTERDLLGYQLTTGISTSCGCYQKEKAIITGRNKAKDLTGQK